MAKEDGPVGKAGIRKGHGTGVPRHVEGGFPPPDEDATAKLDEPGGDGEWEEIIISDDLL